MHGEPANGSGCHVEDYWNIITNSCVLIGEGETTPSPGGKLPFEDWKPPDAIGARRGRVGVPRRLWEYLSSWHCTNDGREGKENNSISPVANSIPGPVRTPRRIGRKRETALLQQR